MELDWIRVCQQVSESCKT